MLLREGAEVGSRQSFENAGQADVADVRVGVGSARLLSSSRIVESAASTPSDVQSLSLALVICSHTASVVGSPAVWWMRWRTRIVRDQRGSSASQSAIGASRSRVLFCASKAAHAPVICLASEPA